MSTESPARKSRGVSAQKGTLTIPETVRKIGGVSAFRGALARERAEAAAAPLAPAFPGFTYNGGPVISCPLVYTSFWGSLWLSDPAHLQEAGRLSQFCKDLVASDFMNVLSQYGVGRGAGWGLFIQASFISAVPATLTDDAIHNVIQSAISNGVIPEPPANNTSHVLMIYLDENTMVDDQNFGVVMCEPSGDDAFGYHWDFTTAAGNPFYYAVIPSLNDACITNTCGGSPNCSLNLSETQEQRRTQVSSHEFAEMCTDPKYPTGWIDPFAGECGDICNGETNTITVGPNTWDVQNQYSKYTDTQTNGAIYCVATEPNPLPRLSPGPSGLSSRRTPLIPMSHYSSFLPLPSVRYDYRTGKKELDENETRAFTKRMLRPFSHENVSGDLPATLHRIADLMASR